MSNDLHNVMMLVVHSYTLHVCTRRCELWNHSPQLEEAELTKEQVRDWFGS